ncbi:MAG TPA: hypothetical protein DCZ95_07720 [Verrucomicrobia bacterium]|nr:MAG: hypothetical protein A2X46_01095 [Lentisphaerae bacterium GWF2_57_35]HBA83963.1 hypothetical protein [Verrucomicrobiota bacterium]
MKALHRIVEGRKCGFTLVEILIVVTLTVLISLFAMPNVIARLPIYRLDSAVERINTQLHVARLEAMAEGQYMGVRFLGSTKAYDIWPTPQKNGAVSESVERFNLSDLKGVSFQAYPSEGHFGPSGSFTAAESWGNTLWIWVYSDSTHEQRSIVVWPSGQVCIYKYNGGYGA